MTLHHLCDWGDVTGRKSSFLPWKALDPVCLSFFFLYLCCHFSSAPTDHVAHLLEEQRNEPLLTVRHCVCDRTWKDERPTKRSGGRLGRSEREAEAVLWPDTAGKEKTTLPNKAGRHSSLFPLRTLLTLLTFHQQREGVIAGHTMNGLVWNPGLVMEYVTI